MIEFRSWTHREEFPPALKDGDVHLWCARLDVENSLAARLEATLSPDERERAGRLALPVVRRRFTVARGHLREILGRYAGLPPGRLRFRYGGSGKPAPAVPDAPRFSVSHTEDHAVFALHRTLELGVDVERLRPIPNGERLAKRFFSSGEHRSLLRVPPERRDFAFLTCWTRKEACAKAVGEPLIPMLKRFEVPVEPGERARVALLDGDPVAAARWSLTDLAPAPGHIGALAVEGPILRVLLFGWPGA